ncbi:MAG: DUF3617 domain-containing protein [Pseudomonadota bacterium]
MTPRLNALAVILLASTCAMPASAQTIKPGLYEITSKVGGDNPMSKSRGRQQQQQKAAMADLTPEQRKQMADLPKQMEKMMADMPPEQRKAMKEMMAKQSGNMEAFQSMQLETNADGSTTMKMCMTKEMVDHGQLMQQQPNCKQTMGKMTGGVMKFSYNCTKPASTAEGEVRIIGPNSFSTKMKMVSKEPGQEGTMEVESTSKWLGTNCGSVKPFTLQR